MKSIVLTFDKHIRIADLVIHTYTSLWSSNPFVFRIPYNNKYPTFLKEKYGNKIELIKTERSIKATMKTLLKDIPDEEWIWWCMDDKYLIHINEKEVNKTYKFVNNLKKNNFGIIMISKNNYVDQHLSKDKIKTPQGQVFIRQKDYHNFFQHCFIKSRVLKRAFLDKSFSNNYKLTDRDNVNRVLGLWDYTPKETRSNEKIFVPQENMVIFGESLDVGKLTKNCQEAFLKYNLPMPNIKLSNKKWILDGRTSKLHYKLLKIIIKILRTKPLRPFYKIFKKIITKNFVLKE